MNGSDIEFEMLQKNGLISIAVKVFIGMLACYAVAGLDYVYFNFIDGSFGNDNPISIIILGLAAGIGMVMWIMFLVFLIMGLKGKIKYNKFFEEHGEEEVMNEIHNETLFIYSRKKKPVTIVTRKHIFELDRNIFSSTDLDYAYGYSYRGATSIQVYDIRNKIYSIANGINLRGEDKKKLFVALATINPDILLGFTGENYKEHKKRVKEYKANNR